MPSSMIFATASARSRGQSISEGFGKRSESSRQGTTLDWLRDVEGDLRYDARPRPKYHRIVLSRRLLALGLELIRRGETSNHLTAVPAPGGARRPYDRTSLALPNSPGNFAGLRIGRQIRRIGDTRWIVLEGAETKSGRPDERPVPEILTEHIDRWLERWRPLFLKPADAFWASIKGGRLAYTYAASASVGGLRPQPSRHR